jgi:predicted permease
VKSALLIAQAALSVMLLIGAGLFVRSLDHVTSMRMGYDAEHVLLANTTLRGVQLDDSARIRLGAALVRAAQALPDVAHASTVMTAPLLETAATYLGVPGIDDTERLGMFSYQVATPDYFRVMGTRILRGRAITDEDRAGAPRVGVVSESMARALWPGQDPIGQRMHVFADTMPWTTVIGVAEDIVQSGVSAAQRYHYYLSSAQFWPQWSSSRLLVRVHGEFAGSAERVRAALQAEMPGESYVTVRQFRELVHAERRSWRLGATLFVAFGMLALIVAAVGLYAVIGHEVTQRMRELGIRMALGARSRHVVRLVLLQGARFAMVGIVLGCAVSLAAGRWLQPLLFRESATDPAVYAAVVVIMLLVTLVASAVPAARALQADPNIVLRSE